MCWLCPCWTLCCPKKNVGLPLENLVNANEESRNLIGTNEQARLNPIIVSPEEAAHRRRAESVNESIRKLEFEEWYHNNASIYEAITLLLWPGNEPGTFLVRALNKAETPFVLSVRTKDEGEVPTARHYAIHRTDDRFHISSLLPFNSVQTLIQTYVNDTDNLLNLCERIRKPCPKVRPSPFELSNEFREEYQLNRDEIVLERHIGEGQFGEVYKGSYRGKFYAVKKLKSNDFDRKDFLKEVLVMRDLQHKNIIRLKGICDGNPFLVVLEYMECGSLKSYMKTHILNKAQRCYVTFQLAEGMAYLESKNIVHRDLAARNILLNPVLTVKVSDFGLSRFMSENQYYTMLTLDTKLPLKWMAPECEFTHKFDSKTDVWSFGITAMEIYTNGKSPYCEKQFISIQHLLSNIRQNYRMPQPDGMPDEIYSIIFTTWRANPEERPSFTDLTDSFRQFTEERETVYDVFSKRKCIV